MLTVTSTDVCDEPITKADLETALTHQYHHDPRLEGSTTRPPHELTQIGKP